MTKQREDHGGILSPELACYHAAHKYPSGLRVLAMMMDRKHDTLRKKLDTAQSSHVLTLEEAMHLLRITGDTRILDAICAEAGVTWFRKDDVTASPADLDVLRSSTGLMDRAVRVITELEKALADGDIDKKEQARLDQCFMRLNQAAHQVSETARQFHRDDD